jgi:transposase
MAKKKASKKRAGKKAGKRGGRKPNEKTKKEKVKNIMKRLSMHEAASKLADFHGGKSPVLSGCGRPRGS